MFSVIVLALLSFFLWGLPAAGLAAEEFRLGVILAKSGEAAVGNSTALEGARLAVWQLNQRGGVLGEKVELVEFDNRSTALHSRKSAMEAVELGVAAVVGANWSSHSLAAAPVLQEAGIPMISPFSTNEEVTRVGGYIFRVCFVDSFQGKIMAKFAFDDLGARKAAVLTNRSARYSEGLSSSFRTSFEEHGGTVVLEEGYLQDNLDFRVLLQNVAVLGPDVLFVPGHVVDSARIIKQAREVGIAVPILGGDGWGDSMYAHTGAALDNTYFAGHWHENADSSVSRQFVESFRLRHDGLLDAGTALAYDAVMVFADAARRADSLAPEAVRETLAATRNFEGVTGKISFDANGDPVKAGMIFRYEQGRPFFVKMVMP